MIQNARVICGSLFIVGVAPGSIAAEIAQGAMKKAWVKNEKCVGENSFIFLPVDTQPCGSWLASDEASRSSDVAQPDAIAGKPAPTGISVAIHIYLYDLYGRFFALFYQINRRSIKPIETSNPLTTPEQPP
ncbi:hypothetical protein N7650_24165 [Pseudomonas sp. GD04058]|uniref:hypothetical protein n=1 Tax=Pseudomonas sp. GD04058 TaxID=2975429 RepID=UPI00244A03F3|nr:hypothetical protein [Pseudomonas sp. GD04058]MDG9885933.1 hypothetical protein [Pseudomonas sp. GD04058]